MEHAMSRLVRFRMHTAKPFYAHVAGFAQGLAVHPKPCHMVAKLQQFRTARDIHDT